MKSTLGRAAVGAKRPLRVPRWVGRLAAGEVVVVALIRGASNAKATREARLATALRELAAGHRRELG